MLIEQPNHSSVPNSSIPPILHLLNLEKSHKSMASSPIPDDVAFTILSKLPLKSLKRFTCVHKSWPPLLENPYFMNMFRTNFLSKHDSSYDDDTSLLLVSPNSMVCSNPKSPYLLSGDKFENIVKLNWSPPFQGEFSFLIGSFIHGIVCLQSLPNPAMFVLWNPATHEFKIIPPSPLEYKRYVNIVISSLGFGYDPVRDDFKLIRLLWYYPPSGCDGKGDGWQVQLPDPLPFNYGPGWEIYSLRSNSWRKLDMPVVHGVPLIDCDSDMCMNGVWHWFGMVEEYRNQTNYLASFNLSNEVFCITPLPLDLSGTWVRKSLVALNESIAVILKNEETASFHIWILGELGVKESWTKLFIIGPLPGFALPIGVGKNGDIFFRKENGELALFDLSTNMLEEISIEEKLDGYSRIRSYKERLLPIRRTEH